MISKKYINNFKTHHDSSRELKNCFQLDIDSSQYLVNLFNKEATRERVLYIHVPFCNKICSFCPFNKKLGLSKSTYHNLVIKQLEELKSYSYMKKEFSSIYFGGGTPTSLSPNQIDEILSYIHNNYNLKDDCEISLETSATELTDEMLDVLVKNKVNRLSIGIQTFNDKYRKLCNRRNSGEFALSRVNKAIEKGIVNTNIDLIYNYPFQTIEELKQDLDIIINSKIAGISFYSLQIHESTPLYKSITKEELEIMNNQSNEYNLYSYIYDTLLGNGFEVFEISKLVRNKMDKYKYITTKHNMGECIPIGIGAGGNIGNYLCINRAGFETYNDIPVSTSGRIVDDKYFLIDKFNFDFQRSSIDLNLYNDILGINLEESAKSLISELILEELIVKEGSILYLTKKGLFFGNNILNDFVSIIIKHYNK